MLAFHRFNMWSSKKKTGQSAPAELCGVKTLLPPNLGGITSTFLTDAVGFLEGIAVKRYTAFRLSVYWLKFLHAFQSPPYSQRQHPSANPS